VRTRTRQGAGRRRAAGRRELLEQFSAPFEWGYGHQIWNRGADAGPAADDWAIVDSVRVPTTVVGAFVLRWRWDTDQNPQIWTHCADIIIVA
jgi:hypothetical protein